MLQGSHVLLARLSMFEAIHGLKIEDELTLR